MQKIAIILFLVITALRANSEEYHYPYHDPLRATVFALEAGRNPHILRQRKLPRLSKNRLPEIFFYQKALHYGVALQHQKAPLVFCIAGTGSYYRTMYLKGIAQGFYNAGMHVVLLSSPTHSNFIATCSSSGAPGLPKEDAKDLNKVMQEIVKELKKDVEISHVNLCGYSLGAMHAAFCAKQDAEENIFPFKRVLMINPPVDLYRSVSVLDEMLKLDPRGTHQLIEDILNRIAGASGRRGGLDFSQHGIRGIYTEDLKEPEKLRQLIGIVFRIKTVNMVFTSDMMTKSGLLSDPTSPPGTYAPLLPYYKAGFKISYKDYFDKLMLPLLTKTGKVKNRDDLLRHLSLESIAPFLNSDSRVFAVTNRDELILNKKEIDFIERTFGNRARIYPYGGHCGNINFKENVDFAVKVIKGNWGVQND